LRRQNKNPDFEKQHGKTEWTLPPISPTALEEKAWHLRMRKFVPPIHKWDERPNLDNEESKRLRSSLVGCRKAIRGVEGAHRLVPRFVLHPR
jgi:hypothetical protein